MSRKLFIYIIMGISLMLYRQTFAQESSPSYLILPAVVHLEGIGTPYGIFAQASNMTKHKIGIFAGKSFDPVNGFGGALSIRPFSSFFKFSIGKIDIKNTQFETTYRRGLDDDDPLIQELAIDFEFNQIELLFWKDRIKLGLLRGKYITDIKKYFTTDEEELLLTDANLADINATVTTFNASVDFTTEKNHQKTGIAFDLRADSQSGRKALSDTRVVTLGLSMYYPLRDNLSFAMRLQQSNASIKNKAEAYDTKNEVTTALGGDCSNISNSGKYAQCERLKDQIADQIVAENTAGTALPLGGAYSLRGYREFRYKATHTAFTAAEIRWNLSKTFSIPFFDKKNRLLQAAFFGEIGFANDQRSQLYKKMAESLGLELIAKLSNTAIRWGIGKGKKKYSWYLTVGKHF